MANAQTRVAEQGLVPVDLPAALAGVMLPVTQENKHLWHREFLSDRVQAMIDREDEEYARRVLEWFLRREPEEPEEVLDRPKAEWAHYLLVQSPAVKAAALGVYGPEDFRDATKEEVSLIKETTLEEWLGLAAENR